MFIVIISVLVAAFVYLGFRIAGPLYPYPEFFWPVTAAFGLGLANVLWMPLHFWTSEDPETSALERTLERGAYLALGALSFLLLFTLARDLAVLLLLPFGRSDGLTGPVASAGLLGATALALAVGIGIALRGPRVVRVEIGAGAAPLRIVQISDLHVGTWIGRRYVEDVVRKIRALGPIDFLFLTGDIGDGDPKGHVEDLAPLAGIETRIGKFSVSGNHEGYWNEAEWNARIRELGFRVLENETAEVASPAGPISIHGISDPQADVARTLATVRPYRYSIFLAHQPHHAEAAIAAGVRLQLSGHTHQGQFLPWNLFIRKIHRFAAGLYREGKTSIYVNRGTGFWGPPVRLGTLSEITLLEVDLWAD